MAEKKEKVPRQPMPEREPQERRENFEEVPLGFSPEVAELEASRCLECKNPKCVIGCPVEIDIPGFISLIKKGDYSAASTRLKEKTALPAVLAFFASFFTSAACALSSAGVEVPAMIKIETVSPIPTVTGL